MTNFVGTPGNDSITGTSGDDVFDLTQGGDDTAFGGAGYNVFVFGSTLTAADYIDRGTGTTGAPTISLDGDYSAGVVVNARNVDSISLGTTHSYNLTLGPGFTDTPYGTSYFSISAANLIAGNTLAFNIGALAVIRYANIIGSAGNDTLIGNATTNASLIGGAGNDSIQGHGGLEGDAGNDTLTAIDGSADGGDGNDLLTATGSYPRLVGGAGDDTLIVDGATGVGTLEGDAGRDSFVFESMLPGSYLALLDFVPGETIDLSAIAGDSFIGARPFSGVSGQVNYIWQSGHTLLQFDTNGDKSPDSVIEIWGLQTLGETAPGSKILQWTVDITPPTLLSTTPFDNDTLVPLSPVLSLTFDEPVQPGIGNIEIHTADGAVVETIDPKNQVAGGYSYQVGPLNPSTSYYVTIAPGVFKDMAGNDFAGISSPNSLNFTTAPPSPSPPPGTLLTNPWSSGNHPVDQDFVFTFSAPVAAGDGEINILPYAGQHLIETIPITDQSRVTISGNTLIVNPNYVFSYGESNWFEPTDYTLLDYAGQTVSFGNVLTVIEQSPDGLTRPVLVSTDTTNVNVNSSIVFAFDQPVTFGAGQFEFRRADGALVQAIGVADSSQVTYSGSIVTVHPTIALAHGVTYSVLLAPGAIRDVAGGNSFAGITSPTAFNFTTTGAADVTAPTLVSTSPADNAANVSVGTDITLHFSEAVQRGSGNIEIHASDGSLFKSIAITDSWQVKFAGSTVTIDPNLDLSLATGYYVIVPSGAIMDYAGNTFVGISSPTALNFNTPIPPDTTPPALRYFSPTDGENDVRVGDNILLMFNETVKAGAGNAVIHRSSDGAAVATIAIGDASQVTFNQNSVTINPSQDLGSATDYYVTLAAGLVTDLAGNPSAGSSSPTAFNFTTVAPPDLTPPLLLGNSPNNATGVGDNPHLILTFNEPMKVGTGGFELHKALDDSIVETIWSNDTNNVVYSGNTVTVSMGAAPGTSYYVTIAPGVVTDLAGNAFAGLSGKFDLKFTTAPPPDNQPPQLAWFTPLDGKTGVPVDANITLTFNEAVKAGTGNIVLHRASDDSVTAFAIGDASHVSIVGNSVTVNPDANLASGDRYYVTIDPGVILDSAGNSFAGIADRTALNFRTGSSSSLQFNITYDQNVGSLPAGFVAAVQAATQLFAARYTDAVTINLHVGYGDIKGTPLDPGALAESAPDFLNYSYSDIRNAIGADASSGADLIGVNSLPAADPTNGGTFSVTYAEAAALGLPNAPSTVDGYIGFSNAAPFDYNNADGVRQGAYDFFAAAAHEVSEVMGRVLGAGVQGAYTPLDLFDYFGGQLAFNAQHVGILSVYDPGTASNPMLFNADTLNGDAGDWDSSVGNDAFDAFAKAGAVFPVSPSDFVVMDALGWDQAVVPVPTPFLLLSTSPSDDSFQVPVAANITLMFNGAVEAGSGDVVIHNASDGSVVETIPITDTARVSFSASVVTINPNATLAERSAFYVTIAPGAITEVDGTVYPGISSATGLNFTTGDAVPNLAPPEIAVQGGGPEIANGDTTISINDQTDFGSFFQTVQPYPHYFTVRNDGGSTLTLGAVNLPVGFVLVDPLVSSLAPGASDAFSVRLDMTTPGTKSGQISFTSNDSNESPFTFAISGTVLAPTPIETSGATILATEGLNFGLLDSNLSGPTLKYFGNPVFAGGQFAPWIPIGAEKTASGYEIAWKVSGDDKYTLWSTDANGNYIANLIGGLPGSDPQIVAAESLFQQDLNGDGRIGPLITPIETKGVTTLATVGNHFGLLDNSNNGPSLKSSGSDVLAGQVGGWTPLGAEKTATGYEIAWKGPRSDLYTLWSTDANGNYIANLVGGVSGSNVLFMSSENLFQQDLNGDGHIGLGATTPIETNGATTLAGFGNRFVLLDNIGVGPSLNYFGSDVTAGEFGSWTPIGAEKTASGYEIAWKVSGSDIYTLWSTDAAGNYIANLIGAVPGANSVLMSAESLFQQDLNGDGQIGPPTTLIESRSATTLAEVGNHFNLLDSNSTGPSLKYSGSDVAAGQFGSWTPIGAEKTGSGYEIAWKLSGADQYTLWSTDANGNYIANLVGAVSGSNATLMASENLFQQDINGDGHIGLGATTPIETKGATSLVGVGNSFSLLDSIGAGPSLKYSGGDVVAGQFGSWTPIGAEKTASGYEIAWKVAGADQYTLWSTDANGDYVANLIGAVSGSNAAIVSAETLFQQDLNGDGQIASGTGPGLSSIDPADQITVAPEVHPEWFL